MLDKAILYGKEFRKPYHGSKSFSCSCRNHGSCSYCRDIRTYNKRKTKEASLMQLKEYNNDPDPLLTGIEAQNDPEFWAEALTIGDLEDLERCKDGNDFS